MAGPAPGTIVLRGDVNLASLASTRTILGCEGTIKAFDLSGVGVLDTAGAWLIASCRNAAALRGETIAVIGASPAQTLLA